MTRAEILDALEDCKARRIKLGVTLRTVGYELGFESSAISKWECGTTIPRPAMVEAYRLLLERIESGKVDVPRTRRVQAGMVNTNILRLRDAVVLSGLLRRMLGVSEVRCAEVLGCSVREFQMKESGLASMTKADLSRLLSYYAEHLVPGPEGSERQLTLFDSLSPKGQEFK